MDKTLVLLLIQILKGCGRHQICVRAKSLESWAKCKTKNESKITTQRKTDGSKISTSKLWWKSFEGRMKYNHVLGDLNSQHLLTVCLCLKHSKSSSEVLIVVWGSLKNPFVLGPEGLDACNFFVSTKILQRGDNLQPLLLSGAADVLLDFFSCNASRTLVRKRRK